MTRELERQVAIVLCELYQEELATAPNVRSSTTFQALQRNLDLKGYLVPDSELVMLLKSYLRDGYIARGRTDVPPLGFNIDDVDVAGLQERYTF